MICVRLSSEAVDLSNLLNLRETFAAWLRETLLAGLGYSWGTPSLGVQWNSDKQRHLVACSY